MGHRDLKAVDDVSFDIKKGEVFGLVGESGCGKTTTGRSIIKLYDITSGDVYFKGIRIGAGKRSYINAISKAKSEYKEKIAQADDPSEKQRLKAELAQIIADNKKKIKEADYDQKNCDKEYSKKLVEEIKAEYLPKIEKASGEEKAQLQVEYKDKLYKAKHTKLVTQIQMIFQDPIASLDPRMTVKEIIAEGLVIQGERNKKVIEEKVYEMLELVGLVREHASRYPHEFSGGQRQRIGVARSIIMNPDMIIADEPVSALDVSIQAQVINLLNELRERLGLTILFVAHDLSVVKYFSDRIGVMYFGKMVELAPSDELFKNPMHPYTKSLLSAIPLPDPIYEKQRQRIAYNPLADHDYSVDQPSFREIAPGHFVMCNDAEFEQYKAALK
ncbi:MAG: ATP-binding cassette domain-containing protein [Lachnospiraceae bacterium]|nr:ATP-binding cassette domain-containing protein [Lachnospiraceae bacterium]